MQYRFLCDAESGDQMQVGTWEAEEGKDNTLVKCYLIVDTMSSGIVHAISQERAAGLVASGLLR